MIYGIKPIKCSKRQGFNVQCSSLVVLYDPLSIHVSVL